mgnify:CR=1 FL=1|tara:strand:- start:1582 stop:2616 length:1035 start_codon:yes stop_codon:yes gene_type:complete
MQNQSVSIIVPHYNNYTILKECIESLTKLSYKNTEIIIIDNNSSDNSAINIKKEFSQIILHQLDENIGYAGACNVGAKIAQGKYLLFINNDTIHKVDFIEHLLKKITSNNKIVAVQPKVQNINNKGYFDYAGASGGLIDYLVFPFTRGRIFNTIEKDNGQYDNAEKVFWTSGVCFITKKNIFLDLDGFDESLFAHMEEIDYCWKCYLAGYECWVEPKAVIYHYGAKTLNYESPKKTYLNHRNSMILLLTNYRLSLSLFLFPIRIFLELLSFVYNLFQLKFIHAYMHIKALIYLLFNIKHLWKRRQLISRIRKVSDKSLFDQNLFLNESIVKKYFLFQQKKYSQL